VWGCEGMVLVVGWGSVSVSRVWVTQKTKGGSIWTLTWKERKEIVKRI